MLTFQGSSGSEVGDVSLVTMLIWRDQLSEKALM